MWSSTLQIPTCGPRPGSNTTGNIKMWSSTLTIPTCGPRICCPSNVRLTHTTTVVHIHYDGLSLGVTMSYTPPGGANQSLPLPPSGSVVGPAYVGEHTVTLSNSLATCATSRLVVCPTEQKLGIQSTDLLYIVTVGIIDPSGFPINVLVNGHIAQKWVPANGILNLGVPSLNSTFTVWISGCEPVSYTLPCIATEIAVRWFATTQSGTQRTYLSYLPDASGWVPAAVPATNVLNQEVTAMCTNGTGWWVVMDSYAGPSATAMEISTDDGITWYAPTFPITVPTPYTGTTVCLANGVWYVTVRDTNPTTYILTSTDLVTFTLRNTIAGVYVLSAANASSDFVVLVDTAFNAIGSGNAFLSWSVLTLTSTFTQIFGIACSNGRWVLSGNTHDDYCLAISDDDLTTLATGASGSLIATAGAGRSVAAGDIGVWAVTTSQGGMCNVLMSHDNGNTWNLTSGLAVVLGLTRIATNKTGVWVIANTQFLSSTDDGSTWTLDGLGIPLSSTPGVISNVPL